MILNFIKRPFTVSFIISLLFLSTQAFATEHSGKVKFPKPQAAEEEIVVAENVVIQGKAVSKKVPRTARTTSHVVKNSAKLIRTASLQTRITQIAGSLKGHKDEVFKYNKAGFYGPSDKILSMYDRKANRATVKNGMIVFE